MDEAELQERLLRNPDLRRRNANNAGIAGNTDIACNTRSTVMPVIQTDEELRAEAEAMLESKLQGELRRIALAAGFLYYHTHDSRRSDKGFLDTVLLRVRLKRGELYFVECKRQNEDLTEEQERWFEAFKTFRGRAHDFTGTNVTVDVFLWRPMDLLDGTIGRTLECDV